MKGLANLVISLFAYLSLSASALSTMSAIANDGLHSGCQNGYNKNIPDYSYQRNYSFKMDRKNTKLFINKNLEDKETGRELRYVWKGCAEEKHVWISPSQSYRRNYKDGHSIGIRVQKTIPNVSLGMSTDKAMWNLRDKDNGGNIKLGEKVYFGLAFKIPENIKEIVSDGKSYMIFQIWQGSPFSPPLSLHLKNNKNKDYFNLEARYLPSVNKHLFPQQILGSFRIKKGQWNEIIIGARLSDQSGGGSFTVWRKNRKNVFIKKIHKSDFRTAYSPKEKHRDYDKKSSKYYLKTPSSLFNATFGIYRRRQPHYLQIFFDDVRTGSTFKSVLLN